MFIIPISNARALVIAMNKIIIINKYLIFFNNNPTLLLNKARLVVLKMLSPSNGLVDYWEEMAVFVHPLMVGRL